MLECSSVYSCVLVFTSAYLCVLACSSMDWYVLMCTGVLGGCEWTLAFKVLYLAKANTCGTPLEMLFIAF